MKKTITLLPIVAIIATSSISAQEESPFSTGVDIYSSYIWRGAKFGSGPAFQPYVDFTKGNLSIGAWGSVNSSIDEALEMDLYVSYSIGDLGIAVTDYYFGGDWLTVDSTQYIEPALSYGIGDFSILGAYMFYPGFSDGDIYLEAGYTLGAIDLAVGLGEGQYTSDENFMICNLSLGTSKEIKITEDFSLPVSGSVVLNPSTGGFFITVGISF